MHNLCTCSGPSAPDLQRVPACETPPQLTAAPATIRSIHVSQSRQSRLSRIAPKKHTTTVVRGGRPSQVAQPQNATLIRQLALRSNAISAQGRRRRSARMLPRNTGHKRGTRGRRRQQAHSIRAAQKQSDGLAPLGPGGRAREAAHPSKADRVPEPGATARKPLQDQQGRWKRTRGATSPSTPRRCTRVLNESRPKPD
jgi:hypothetical protein